MTGLVTEWLKPFQLFMFKLVFSAQRVLSVILLMIHMWVLYSRILDNFTWCLKRRRLRCLKESGMLLSGQWHTLPSIKHTKHTHWVFGISSVDKKTNDFQWFLHDILENIVRSYDNKNENEKSAWRHTSAPLALQCCHMDQPQVLPGQCHSLQGGKWLCSP